jgi:hypothetical protein
MMRGRGRMKMIRNDNMSRRGFLERASLATACLSLSARRVSTAAPLKMRNVMKDDFVARTIKGVDEHRLRDDIFSLAKNPIPMRKLNLTLSGHQKSTLYEADDYLTEQMTSCGYEVKREEVQVQAFRCDRTKPKAHQYSQPLPEDPWYAAYNLYAERRGSAQQGEIILLLAHKDSQSWVDSPGAYDNAVGTAAVVELARNIATLEPRRTVRFLFCNEEHTPWTSVVAARNARRRGDNLVAIFNLDGLGGKSQLEIDSGIKTNVTMFTVQQGKELADLMTEVNQVYSIGLRHSIGKREHPNDDDGSFVRAGYGRTVINIGSFPYADPEYHREGDVAERVDFENVSMTTQATLAAVLELDREV